MSRKRSQPSNDLVTRRTSKQYLNCRKCGACSVADFKTKAEGASVYPVMLNLDLGPDQEAWNNAQREAFLGARRDRPMPEPLPVSAENKDGWSVDNEDVPVIEFDEPVAKENTKEEKFVCSTCTVNFKTENALSIHKGRAKHT